MGREAMVTAVWRGETAEVKALLESTEVILRGPIRVRLPRAEVTAVTVEGEYLRLLASGEPLTLLLGAAEAGKWAAALRKPPPSLADKLGVSAETPAFVTGPTDDAALGHALDGAVVDTIGDASFIVAVVEDPEDLHDALALAQSAPHLPLWCVYPKGTAGPVTDALVRSFLRDHGYIDAKSCAVSDRLTATRYAPRRA